MKNFFTVTLLSCTMFLLNGSVPLWGAPVQEEYQYLFEMKADPNEEGSLNQPAGIAISDGGQLYVTDTVNSRVVVFNDAGKVTMVIGKPGTGNGEFKLPMALALDSGHKKLYVADSSNHRVQVFKTDGTFLSVMDLNKNMAEGEKKVRPVGIAVAGNGNIYVSDVDNNYIRVYSDKGKELFKFGGLGKEDGRICVPVGLYVDKDDKLYVVDMHNFRVQVFDKDGKFLFKMGSAGDTKGSFGKIKDICVDTNGRIYVSDGANLVVQIFDRDGNFVDLIGAEENADLQFASPFGLAVNNDRLYVTDRRRNSIRVYEIK